MLTPVHNNTKDADDYNKVIGIAQLKLSAVLKIGNYSPRKTLSGMT